MLLGGGARGASGKSDIVKSVHDFSIEEQIRQRIEEKRTIEIQHKAYIVEKEARKWNNGLIGNGYEWLTDVQPTAKEQSDFKIFRERIFNDFRESSDLNQLFEHTPLFRESVFADFRESPDLNRPFEHILLSPQKFNIRLAFSPDNTVIYLALFRLKPAGAHFFAWNFDTNQKISLDEFVEKSLISDWVAEEVKLALTEAKVDSKPRLIVDEKILEYTDQIEDLQKVKEVNVISKTPPPPIYQARRFKMETPPPNRWFVRVKGKGCCLYSGIPPSFLGIKKMEKIKFHKKDLRVLSLLSDEYTDKVQTLERTGIRKDNIFYATELKSSPTKKKIKSIFQKHRGKSFFVIGHVEGKSFVTVENEKPVVKVDIEELQELADKYQVNLLLLGCYTETAVRANNNNYLGTLSKIHARRTIEQLASAITNESQTWADFLQYLSAVDIPLIVGADFLYTHPKEEKKTEGSQEKKYDNAKKTLIQGNLTIVEDNKEVNLQVGQIWIYIHCPNSNNSGECED